MLTTDTQFTELGSVRFGKAHTFPVLIKNVGDKDVKIKKLSVSCGSCTVAHVQPSLIKPGNESTVTITFTPGTIGPQKKFVDILYDDTSLRLEFKANSHE